MEPALDPIWMGPIMIGFVVLWFASAFVVFTSRPRKERPATRQPVPPPAALAWSPTSAEGALPSAPVDAAGERRPVPS